MPMTLKPTPPSYASPVRPPIWPARRLPNLALVSLNSLTPTNFETYCDALSPPMPSVAPLAHL